MRICIIADLHVGSAFAPWPIGEANSAGCRVEPNVGQRYLNAHWQRIAGEVPAFDVLVLGGDIIGGGEPKAEGRWAVEPDPGYQCKAAEALLAPYLAKLVQGGEVVYIAGTEYHEGPEASDIEALARRLGAKEDRYGHCAQTWVVRDWGGWRVDIAHRQGLSQRMPLGSNSVEGQYSDMNALQADIIIRSHSHRASWAYEEGANKHPFRLLVSTPAWQLQTRHAQRSTHPNRLWSRNLGLMILELTPDAAWVRPYVFDHPRMVGDEPTT